MLYQKKFNCFSFRLSYALTRRQRDIFNHPWKEPKAKGVQIMSWTSLLNLERAFPGLSRINKQITSFR